MSLKLVINYSEVEPLLRSMGNGAWEEFCHNVIMEAEKLIMSKRRKGPKVVRQRSLQDIAGTLADRFRRNNWSIGSATTILNLSHIIREDECWGVGKTGPIPS